MQTENNICIDKNKCTLCGNCTKICGSKTLEIIDKSIVQTYPVLCCSCGHCAAICPENAIVSSGINHRTFNINEIDENLSEIEKLFISKRSVREFKNQNIENNILENLIYFAEKAPSSGNARMREYIVINDKSKILELEKAVIGKFNSLKFLTSPFLVNTIKLFNKKLSQNLFHIGEDIKKLNRELKKGNFPIFRNAPCVIIITGPKGAVQAKDDCIIAQQYLMLNAHSKGIGSCIIGYAQYAHKSIEKVLNIKKGYSAYAISVLGYSQFSYKKEILYVKKPEVNWI